MSVPVAEQFQQHPVWPQLAHLDAAIADAEQALEGAEAHAHQLHASLAAFAEYIRSSLDACDPALVPRQKLDAISNGIEPVAGDIDQFAQVRDPGRLERAWNRATAVLDQVGTLPTIKTTASARGLASSIGAYQRRMDHQVQEVRAQADELRVMLDNLNSHASTLAHEVDAESRKIADAITSFNSKATEDQSAHNAALTEFFNEFRTKLTKLENAAASQRTQEETQAGDQRGRFRDEIAQHIEEWSQQADEEYKRRTQQAEQLIAELNGQLAEAQKLVGMTGEAALKGDYRKNADEQGKAADYWRWATVGASVAAVLSAIIVTVLEFVFAPDPNWTVIARGTTVTLALSGLATFLGFQTADHREKEQQYRSLELELATLDPFLNSLDEDERKRIKALLAMRYFIGIETEPIDEPNSTIQ